MKKTAKCFVILLFFLAICLNFACFCVVGVKTTNQNNSFCFGFVQTEKVCDTCFEVFVSGRKFKFESDMFDDCLKLSNQQEMSLKNKKDTAKKLKSMGFDNEEIAKYLCPESIIVLNKIKTIANKKETDGTVTVVKNKCKLSISNGKQGAYLNEKDFFEKVYQNILKSNKKMIIEAKIESTKPMSNIKEKLVEKSCFSTNFSTSSAARKNNIAVALEMFDGLILEEGEVLSFNKTTGERNEKTGYQKAKIISGGTFVEGFGGGVCQVSTTLYNACLLAGLEILEVHSHSLPVSYVEPSFDAMVNSGSSDLIVRNNSGSRIIFTSSSENDICKIKIFGVKNKFKITRFSEKTKIIPAEPEVFESDYKKYGDFELEPGETKRISYAKNGFCSTGYLNLYNAQGELVETKKIRENKYNATKGVVLINNNEN